MTDEAGEVRRLLAPLRDRPVSVDAERLAARRTRVVSSLKRETRELAAARATRPRRRAGIAALSLAAAAGLLFGVRALVKPSAPPNRASITFVGSVGEAVVRGAAGPRSLRSGENLSADPGDLETAEAGSAELVSGTGLGLHLGSATRISLTGLVGGGAKNQVALRQGTLTCSVPHLNEGQHFSVATPDARAVVHGTVFSVRVDSTQPSGAQTCVSVTDGVVIVQHAGAETALNAGDSWGCQPNANKSDTVGSSARSDTPSEDDGAARTAPRSAARAPGRGTLTRENALFQAALAADRLGQRDRAQLELNRLLSKYPSSPLVPEARRALSRIANPADGK